MRRALPVACFVLVLSCKGQEAPPKTALDSKEAWCPDGFEAGPENTNTCFAVPDEPPKNAAVLIYLHGMLEGRGSPEEWARVRSATQQGFAVVVPRGKKGLCAWTAELQNHYCWPHESEDPAAWKPIVAEWNKVLWQVDSLLEDGTHKRYVLGVGNGGTFASYLAASGTFDAAAFAMIGSDAVPPPAKPAKTPPVLLVSADGSDQAPKTRDLHEGLLKAAWPHAFCPRAGAATLAQEDFDRALKFFKRDADGSLKADKKTADLACDASADAPAKKRRE